MDSSAPLDARRIGLAYVIAAVILGALDGVWLGLVATQLYFDTLGPIMAPSPRWLAAGLFYGIYVAGVVYFVIVPAARARSPGHALGQGLLLGALAYATYDLTNLATVGVFTWTLALIDIAWGAVLTATTSALTVLVLNRL